MPKPETIIQKTRDGHAARGTLQNLRHRVSEPPPPLSPVATTLDAVASPSALTAITTPGGFSG